jgi:hypothetical protein
LAKAEVSQAATARDAGQTRMDSFVDSATMATKDGQMIKVDGKNGIVRILEVV